MKNKYVLIIMLLSGLHMASFGQIGTSEKIDNWKAVAATQHQRGNWLFGAGLTAIGGTAKAGYFVANRTWIGLEAETHNLFTERREAGIFGRYYLWNGGFSGFTEVGLSYGRFQQQPIFANNPLDYPVYRTTKPSAAFGLAYLVGRRVSLEGVFKLGKASCTDGIQPSLQGSLNYYLRR